MSAPGRGRLTGAPGRGHCAGMELKPRRVYDDPLPNCGFETLCTHYAEDPAEQQGAAAPPIYQTSTFIYPDAEAFWNRRRGDGPHYDYTRVGNPTTAMLEAKLARLEGGTWAYGFGSGMGAISAALRAVLKAGDHVVAQAHVYGPTQTYLRQLARFGIEATFLTTSEAGALLGACRPQTRLIYFESPTSGHFEIVDIRAVVAGARGRGIVTAFDNSWATPYFQRPLELGVDLVTHSATKYLNGHSDVVAGFVVGRDDGELHARVQEEVEYAGATLDPFAAWLMLRGLRTLPMRMEYHQRSALAVARMLAAHGRVAVVNHPGLERHPGHELARRQMRGCSSLFSFALHDQSREATARVLDRLRLFRAGVSWGGHESLAIGGTFFSAPDEPKRWLIRLHVGLESTEDLLADLRQALED